MRSSFATTAGTAVLSGQQLHYYVTNPTFQFGLIWLRNDLAKEIYQTLKRNLVAGRKGDRAYVEHKDYCDSTIYRLGEGGEKAPQEPGWRAFYKAWTTRFVHLLTTERGTLATCKLKLKDYKLFMIRLINFMLEAHYAIEILNP